MFLDDSLAEWRSTSGLRPFKGLGRSFDQTQVLQPSQCARMGDLEAPCGRWGESSWLLIRRRGIEESASLMTAEFLACEAICVPFGASATIARQQIDRIGIE